MRLYSMQKKAVRSRPSRSNFHNMGTLEKQKHGGALYRPAKGETQNPNGRLRKLDSSLEIKRNGKLYK